MGTELLMFSTSPGLCHGAATEMDRSVEAGWILAVTQAVLRANLSRWRPSNFV